jgi:hypothetical protein
MPKGQRVILFSLYLFVSCVISFVFNGKIIPTESSTIVIYSSLVMLCFIVLFVEHFFSKPTDVLASSISILLLLSPIKSELLTMGVWYDAFFIYNLLLVILSLVALLLLDSEKAADSVVNRVSLNIKIFVTAFGNGKFLFYALFILSLLFYVDNQSNEFLILFGFSVVILLIDPKKYYLKTKKVNNTEGEIGTIFSVQSSNTYLAKLYKNKPLKNNEYIQFSFNEGNGSEQHIGVVIDIYVLDGQRWSKILKLEDLSSEINLNVNLNEKGIAKIEIPENATTKTLIGTVVDFSNIKRVRFEENVSGNVEEGTLLQLKCANKNILYQVLQGTTYTESLESRNEAAGVVGEALQLGSWNSEEFTFNRFGWVPPVNSPLYIADNIEAQETPEGYLNIGTIPNTNYPIFLNKETAITHHLAILGVTGTGKSVFTRNLVRNIASQETKVIIVDFTLEHSKRLIDLDPKPVVTEDKQEEIFSAIDVLSAEYEKFANQRNPKVIADSEKIIKVNFYNAIKEFMQGEDRLRLFELPDVANSTAILEYTKWFFKALFAIARNENNYGRKVCVVLEEAHTVIPEWNFVGVSDKSAQSLVNSIGQIALQGRKYGIGFVIVAQRTANVSKTVLTQCNSIIAFQQFDRTSGEFLSNYVGDDMVQALPTLKFKQAIAVGKAFKANIPLIFEVPNIEE